MIDSTVDLYELLKDYEAEIGYPIIDSSVPSRSGHWEPLFIVDHHTASNAGSGPLPALGIVRRGRSDVPGPLAHLLTGRNGHTHVTCRRGRTNNAGRCNGTAVARMKQGLGPSDPNRAPGPDTSGSGANTYSIGHEKENNGLGETWSTQCIEAASGVQAAICREAGWDPALRIAQHKALSRRKIDSSYDGRWWVQQVASKLAAFGGGPTPQEWDQMATQQEIADAVQGVVEEQVALAVMAITGDQFEPSKLREADVFDHRDLEAAIKGGVVAVGVQIIEQVGKAQGVTVNATEVAQAITDELARRLA